ncbi:phosphoethanolamine--lipid A transferase [Comamonas thiooxydans]|nr:MULTISPECIES: phosphoethanolamine--lipid A transferase [Comamonas]MDH1255912.1 phosphoethanolamine--lipid A transferase [Comamonas thiooxydans]MDH1337484.1 phosphoethanolamine--lipid A transferase [Comamonas thiooxydans]MDH1477699.1 phosphoethanolamine--lipid A transferase [Comamonas thiooxydans]MDH1743645.1 phosphoethanolamine--lipid A transferase [Comamonas thiooxydans]MDH1789963.1 phosphoethanolamine--lipid A transferase [Comamonas thiooxydans]
MIIGVSIWIAIFSNYYLWLKISKLGEESNISLIISFVFILIGVNIFSISVLGWGWLLRPIASIFVVGAASGAYFMQAYGIVIDSNMITNVLQTDFNEASDLINLQMIFVILLLSLPPLWFIWRRNFSKSTFGKLILQRLMLALLGISIAVVSLIVSFQAFSSTMRNHKEIRYLINPYNGLYAVFKKIDDSQKRKSKDLVKIGEGAYIEGTIDPIVFLVVGETARSDHLGLNGYLRDTTPLLSSRKDILSFKNAWACGTSTAESLPCMFSHLSREEFFDRSENYENLLDVLKRAGLDVLWVDNQSGCKGVCARIPASNQEIIEGNINCRDDGCFDAAVLNNLQKKIEDLPKPGKAKGTVILVHQMGSHGPAYYKRSSSDRKAYFPECDSSALQTCSRDQVVNAYDNSIRETDYFISNAIDWIKETYPDRPTAMMYVSDHGESLGENNIYLHGLPYSLAPDAQKRIPWIAWFSESFKREKFDENGCAALLDVDAKISHDNYFHSVLGMMNVKSEIYNPDLDIFKKCRKY